VRNDGTNSPSAASGRPTIESIARGDFVENERLDFKRQLNLNEEMGRHRLIDDVVAFLNRGNGTILVGIEESQGRFSAFHPIELDRDALSRRVVSTLQDGILPTPLDIRVHFLDVDGGFILDIEIPAHRNGPFQAKYSGAFLIRTAAQNRPVSPSELRGYFVNEKQWLDAAGALTREESEKLARSERMTERGPVLQFGILPRAHFDPQHPHFTQHAHWRSVAPSFEDRARILFRGSDGGQEAFAPGGDGKGSSRLLVRDDWFVHGWVAWPLWVVPGEEILSLYKFKTELLPAFLSEIDEFLNEQQIGGPYAVVMELAHLQRDAKVGRFFSHNEAVTMMRPRFVDRMVDMSDRTGPAFDDLRLICPHRRRSRPTASIGINRNSPPADHPAEASDRRIVCSARWAAAGSGSLHVAIMSQRRPSRRGSGKLRSLSRREILLLRPTFTKISFKSVTTPSSAAT
jgi:hypothetical protein